MPKQLTLTIFLLLAAFMQVTHAEAVNYAGLSIGVSAADEDCDYWGYNCDGNETAVKVFAGRRMHLNLALEIAYHDLGRLSDKSTSATSIADSEGINLSIHGIIPVMENMAIYGKIGTMAWDTRYTRIGTSTVSSTDQGTDFTFGAGFYMQWDDKYQLRFEFERLNELGNEFVPGGSDITLWSLGGAIHF